LKPHLSVFIFSVLLLASSCVYHDVTHTVDCALVVMAIEIDEQVDASTCGATDGRIALHVNGGMAPYRFSIGDGTRRSAGTFDSLTAGLYTVTVADQNGCQVAYDSILIDVTNFSVTLSTTEDTDCVTGNGRVEVTVNETTGPYRYAVDGGEFTDSNIIEGLKHGDHFVTIADADGCGVRKGVTIPRGLTGVSWQKDILPIMQTRCAITGCHNGISRVNDWRVYTQVKANAADIRMRTQNKSMPFDSGMPQANIDLIACWIDEGAQNN
jgi:hypothetical protein